MILYKVLVINNPPEGMTSKDIHFMSEDELLDMDYFLNDDELDLIQESAAGGLSYKVKK